MKSLLIIRHAKSGRDDVSLSDFERPLADRGLTDAPTMGKRLAKRGVKPDLVVSSPATRALATARLIARELDYPERQIRHESKLYAANVEDWIETLQNLPDDRSCIALVGHNPAIEELLEILAPGWTQDVPTCAVAELQTDIPAWKDLTPAALRPIHYDFPKNKAD